MKRWHMLHVGGPQWANTPEQLEIPLEITPSPDMRAFAIPGLLVLWAVGGIESSQDAYGIDPTNGQLLWRFSETDRDLLFFHCHVECHQRIVATTRQGVYRLTREGPQELLRQKLTPAAVGRLSPDGSTGFVLDEQQRLLIFSTQDGAVKWSRRPPKGARFGHPFPLDEARVCLATGGDVRCWKSDGTQLWRWPAQQTQGEQHAIERLIHPDLLLIRTQRGAESCHTTLRLETGEHIADLGDVWAYGADGVADHPIVLFEGTQETITFLDPAGTCEAPQKIHKVFGGFRTLPAGYAALWYDALTRMIVATDDQGDVTWKESYPDASSGLAAVFFGPDTAFFACPSGTLHIWDVASEG